MKVSKSAAAKSGAGKKKGTAPPSYENARKLPPREGFSKLARALKRRMIVKVAGQEGTGKTRLPLTGPSPIVGLLFDDGGLEGVGEQFADIPEAVFRTYTIPESGDQSEAIKVYETLRSDWLWALANARTTFLDAEPELWELFRMAEFGATNPSPYAYRPVNAKYRKFIREAYDSDCNVFILSKMYPEYEESAGGGFPKRTGLYAERGFKDLGSLVQVTVEMERTDGNFSMRVGKCRQKGEIGGMVFEDDDVSFDTLAKAMFPHLNPEDFRR